MKKVLLSLFMVAFLLPFATQAQTKVHYDTIITHNEEVCDSLVWMDGVTYTKDTTVTFVNATKDTLHFLNLTVWPSCTTTLDPITTACGYRLSDGTAYFENGQYTDTLQTIHQCDSIVSFQLTITDKDITKDSIVAGCLSYKWQGATYRNDTAFCDTIKTVNEACDTIVNLTINVNEPTPVQSFDTIRACDAYTYRPSIIGGPQTFKKTSDYTEHFPVDKKRCIDSTKELHIIINKTVHTKVKENACGSFVFNDVEYTTNLSNKEIKVGVTSAKCDSIVDLTLTINPYPVISIEGDWELEVGDTARLHANCDIKNSTYTWKYLGKTSNKDSIEIPDIDKNFDVTLTAKSPKGCESTTWITITSYVSIDGVESANINIYPNPTSRYINITSDSPVQNVVIYNMAGQQVINTNNLGAYNNIDLSNLTAGNYTIRMSLENGTTVTKKFIVNK